ncbi:MAG TPA: hypothetical protein DC000_04645 [Clostridiales bacterium]|nr:hypothetical protein [Clostridiales bacterium]
MFFKKKVDKVLDAKKINIDNEQEKIELEKNDMAALLIAGFITMLPALLIVLAIILGVTWFFLR